MRSLFKTIICLLCGVGLVACATPYGAKGLMGGVDTTWIGPNTLMVSAKGNGYTSNQRLNEMMLLRVAEEAIAQNYSMFTVSSSQDTSSSYTAYIAGQQTTNFSAYSSGNNIYGSATTNTAPSYAVPVFKPGSDLVFQMFNEAPEGMSPGSYFHAAFIYNSIGPKYIKDHMPMATQKEIKTTSPE